MNSALLVIDMINDFLLPGAPLEVPMGRDIISNVKCKLDIFLGNQDWAYSVILVNDMHNKDDREFDYWPKHALFGTTGSCIYDELIQYIRYDRVSLIGKRTYSGFLNTRLERILIERQIDDIYIVGILTNVCVFVTAIEAQMRGYGVYIYRDSVAASSQDANDRALETLENTFKVRVI